MAYRIILGRVCLVISKGKLANHYQHLHTDVKHLIETNKKHQKYWILMIMKFCRQCRSLVSLSGSRKYMCGNVWLVSEWSFAPSHEKYWWILSGNEVHFRFLRYCNFKLRQMLLATPRKTVNRGKWALQIVHNFQFQIFIATFSVGKLNTTFKLKIRCHIYHFHIFHSFYTQRVFWRTNEFWKVLKRIF